MKHCYIYIDTKEGRLYLNKFRRFDPAYNVAYMYPLNWGFNYAIKHNANLTMIEEGKQ